MNSNFVISTLCIIILLEMKTGTNCSDSKQLNF